MFKGIYLNILKSSPNKLVYVITDSDFKADIKLTGKYSGFSTIEKTLAIIMAYEERNLDVVNALYLFNTDLSLNCFGTNHILSIQENISYKSYSPINKNWNEYYKKLKNLCELNKLLK